MHDAKVGFTPRHDRVYLVCRYSRSIINRWVLAGCHVAGLVEASVARRIDAVSEEILAVQRALFVRDGGKLCKVATHHQLHTGGYVAQK